MCETTTKLLCGLGNDTSLYNLIDPELATLLGESTLSRDPLLKPFKGLFA